MAMCESLHCTSPLPSPGQTRNNSNRSMSLNIYITHPIGAGPGDPLDHTHVPLDLGRNQLGCEISSYNSACHNYCKAGNHKCYEYSLNQCFTQKPSNSHYTLEFYSLLPLPLPHALPCHVRLPHSLSFWRLDIIFLLTANMQQMLNDNMSLVYYIHAMADNTLVSHTLYSPADVNGIG